MHCGLALPSYLDYVYEFVLLGLKPLHVSLGLEYLRPPLIIGCAWFDCHSEAVCGYAASIPARALLYQGEVENNQISRKLGSAEQDCWEHPGDLKIL